jgi:hydrogenase maturation protease
VLGLGNVLCGDDGLGVFALERMRRSYTAPDHVEWLDGGTLGLTLLAHIEEAEEVFVLDAIRAEGGEPGELVRIDGDEVEPALRERLSPHQVGVADLLDALRWRDTLPGRMRLLGLVPGSLEPVLGLSPPVVAALPVLVEAVALELAAAGHPLVARGTHEAAADRLDGFARALRV